MLGAKVAAIRIYAINDTEIMRIPRRLYAPLEGFWEGSANFTYKSTAGKATEMSVGAGSVRSVATMNSKVCRRIPETSSSKPGGAVCNRSRLAGANAITSKASKAPASDQDKTINMDRRDLPSPHHQAAHTARNSIVIISAVGGSERPPARKGPIKHTAWIQREGERSRAFLICFSRNTPRKSIKTSGAKCDVMPARQYRVSYISGACRIEK